MNEIQHEPNCAHASSGLRIPCTCITGRLAANPYIGNGDLEAAWVTGYYGEVAPAQAAADWKQAFDAGRAKEEADRAELLNYFC
jgi:hypothetical protein